MCLAAVEEGGRREVGFDLGFGFCVPDVDSEGFVQVENLG